MILIFIESIFCLKETIKPKHDGHVAHSFIRRKLLHYLFKQRYPSSAAFGDNEIDMDIDRRIGDLRHDKRLAHITCTDEVFYECLLRSNFEHDQACQMLLHNRPNLVNIIDPSLSEKENFILVFSSNHLFCHNNMNLPQRHWRMLVNVSKNSGMH